MVKGLAKFLKVFKILAIMIAAVIGLGVGLYVGGGIYPFIDRVGPALEKFPWVGQKVYPLVEKLSPPLTGFERRLKELEQEKAFILEQQKLLEEREQALERKRQELEKERAALKKQLDRLKAEAAASQKDKKESISDMVGEAVAEMPASKAAKILSKLPLPEVMQLLEIMESEQRMQVLSKMAPELASKIIYYARMKGEEKRAD